MRISATGMMDALSFSKSSLLKFSGSGSLVPVVDLGPLYQVISIYFVLWSTVTEMRQVSKSRCLSLSPSIFETWLGSPLIVCPWVNPVKLNIVYMYFRRRALLLWLGMK